jgi:hypothetical protein
MNRIGNRMNGFWLNELAAGYLEEMSGEIDRGYKLMLTERVIN